MTRISWMHTFHILPICFGKQAFVAELFVTPSTKTKNRTFRGYTPHIGQFSFVLSFNGRSPFSLALEYPVVVALGRRVLPISSFIARPSCRISLPSRMHTTIEHRMGQSAGHEVRRRERNHASPTFERLRSTHRQSPRSGP